MHGSLRVNAFKESHQSKTNFVLLYLNNDINYYHKNFQESKMQFFGICLKDTNAKTSHSKIRTLQVSTVQKKKQKPNQRKINYLQTAILFYAAKKSFNSINVCTILINDLMKKK